MANEGLTTGRGQSRNQNFFQDPSKNSQSKTLVELKALLEKDNDVL